MSRCQHHSFIATVVIYRLTEVLSFAPLQLVLVFDSEATSASRSKDAGRVAFFQETRREAVVSEETKRLSVVPKVDYSQNLNSGPRERARILLKLKSVVHVAVYGYFHQTQADTVSELM